MQELVFLGVKHPEKLKEFLENKDPCFGKLYQKGDTTCEKCLAPVLLNGEVFLLNEVCKNKTNDNEESIVIKKLTSKQVLQKIQQGATATELLTEMIGESTSKQALQKARTILARRFAYIENKKGLPVPELPTISEILKDEE